MSDPVVTPKKRHKELRGTDLKAELERRGLANSGGKAGLAGRIQKQREDEGAEPDTLA